jgi:hypothetical protein
MPLTKPNRVSRNLVTSIFALGILFVPRMAGSEVIEIQSPDQEFARYFGFSVCSVPDVNGDSFDDIAVGALGEVEGETTFAPGRVFLFDGATRNPLRSLTPLHSDTGLFGESVVGISDLNGNGLGEVVVGAHIKSTSAELAGKVYVFDGSTGETIHQLVPTQNGDNRSFGQTVSSVPDVNEDGVPEILVGAPADSADEGPIYSGLAYVYDGASGAEIATIVSPTPETYGEFGFSVSGVPDINGDHRGDVIIGAPNEGSSENGLVHLYNGFDGSFIRTLRFSPRTLVRDFGNTVSGISDINGDGLGDVLVADRAHGESSLYAAGRAFVFDGFSGSLVHTLTAPRPIGGGHFGRIIAPAPDLNGNGSADVLVSAESETQEPDDFGHVNLYDGETGEILERLTSPDPRPYQRFGNPLAGFGDLNGDWLGEVIVGVPVNNNPPPGPEVEGKVYILTSPYFTPDIEVNPSNLDFPDIDLLDESRPSMTVTVQNLGNENLQFHDEGFQLTSSHPIYSEFGFTEQPSLSDLAPGATREISVRFNPRYFGDLSGTLEIESNDPDESVVEIPLTGYAYRSPELARILSPSGSNSGFASSVGGIPDFTGDGRGDLAIVDNRVSYGPASVLRLVDGSERNVWRTIEPPDSNYGGSFGWSVSGSPDLNGNGSGEIIVGVPWENDYEPPLDENVGRAYVFDGSTGEMLHRLVPPATIEVKNFGFATALVPDIDGDGRNEIAVTSEGHAYVFDGASGQLIHTMTNPATEVLEFDSSCRSGCYGGSVSGIPDVNGDGAGDIVVGGIWYRWQGPRDGTNWGTTFSDSAYIYDGSSGVLLTELVEPNSLPYNRFGIAVSGIPDVNGDGHGDVIVGDALDFEFVESQTRAYIFDGANGDLLQTLDSPEGDPQGGFGARVCGTPDLNGNGGGDVVVSAMYEDYGAGRVYLFDGHSGALIQTLTSSVPDDFRGHFGSSISTVPDIDQDGLIEILVGAPDELIGHGYASSLSGRAYLFSPPFELSDIEVSPLALDFGEQDILQGLLEGRSMVIENRGPGHLAFKNLNDLLRGVDAHDFEVADTVWSCPTCPAASALPAGASLEVSVRFDPGTSGPKEGFLLLLTTASDDPLLKVDLSGVGTGPAIMPTPTIDPDFNSDSNSTIDARDLLSLLGNVREGYQNKDGSTLLAFCLYWMRAIQVP